MKLEYYVLLCSVREKRQADLPSYVPPQHQLNLWSQLLRTEKFKIDFQNNECENDNAVGYIRYSRLKIKNEIKLELDYKGQKGH